MRRFEALRRLMGITLSVFLVFPPSSLHAATSEVTIPSDTRVYVVTKEEVIGKKKFVQEGQPVSAMVWRDVVIDDRVVVQAGAPVLVRVDELKKAKVAGIRGQLSLGAYETTTVDGKRLQLAGGYNKKGKGRIALSASLAGLVLLPLIFIKGKAARLPVGTVFDAYSDEELAVAMEGPAVPTVSLRGVLSAFRVEVLYDKLEQQEVSR